MIDIERALRRESLTVSEAAAVLGCSGESIRRYMSRGLLPGWRLPTGHRRIPAEAVVAMRLESEQVHPVVERLG